MKDRFESLVDLLFNNGLKLEESVAILERSLLIRALERTKNNRCAASKLLGIHRNTLQRKIEQYQLDSQSGRRKPPQKVTRTKRSAVR